jgi:1-deoxy-D-xylulose-5-phosphate reductoisomerase
MKRGGNSPCIVNAANEVAVAAFLKDKIGFMQIPELIEYALQNIEYIKNPSEDDYFSTDELTRIKVSEQIN